mgnify:CR=1 FL=1
MIINQEDVMYIIAGLGNPGKEYMGTRHNAGFSVIDELADKYNISVDTAKHKGLIGKGVIAGQKVILVKPMTYMNNSGECIREVMDYYKCDIDDFIVIFDDISLDVGKLRLRAKGSAGGHNQSILHYPLLDGGLVLFLLLYSSIPIRVFLDV